MEINISVLDKGYVKYIENWGSDERIIESARMSTGKGFKGWPEDEKLLEYLWNNKHLTPFEMAGLTVEIQAPIFVFREWHRHRTQSYNEMSGRYTVLPDLFYVPTMERLMWGKQNTKNKQGSEAGFSESEANEFQQDLLAIYESTRYVYDKLLKQGMSKELARLVLPVSQYSRMRASANLRNWLGFLALRMDKAAQYEIRQYANTVGEIISTLFPRTFALYKRTYEYGDETSKG